MDFFKTVFNKNKGPTPSALDKSVDKLEKKFGLQFGEARRWVSRKQMRIVTSHCHALQKQSSVCNAGLLWGGCRQDGKATAGWASLRGKRPGQEDTCYCSFQSVKGEDGVEQQVGLFGVFDGKSVYMR